MVKGKCKRSNNISDYFKDTNLLNEVNTACENNEPVTASKSKPTHYFTGSSRTQYSHRKSIEQKLGDSQDIKSLVLFLASIGLCLGTFR